MKHKITLKNVWKKYKDLPILENISFTVQQGEFVSIIGSSGCGKTTLLHLIQEFTEPSKGTIEINGKKGFIFQDHNIFPWKTIKENIEIGPLNQRIDKDKVEQLVLTMLKEIGLIDFKDYYPYQISEGMKQRVGIARCLVNNPEILLMDEPFASLDYLTRLKMQSFLQQILKKENLTVLFVTHDIDEAIKLSDRIIVLSERPAKIKYTVNVKKFSDKTKLKESILNLLKNHNFKNS